MNDALSPFRVVRLEPATGMINPLVFRDFQNTRRFEIVCAADGSITVNGERFLSRGSVLRPGVAYFVWLARFFVCAERDQVLTHELAEQREFEEREMRRIESERRARDAARDQANAFNKALKLPVAWDVGIKDRLSGLSAASWGDGYAANTVHHILLKEDMAIGRLKRRANDFLCSSNSRQNGKRWTDDPITRMTDGAGLPFAPQITCKACLEIASRLSSRL